MTQRQWRTYLAVWLCALAAIAGVSAALLAPRLLVRPHPAALGGGLVMGPHQEAAPDFKLSDQRGETVSLSAFRGKVIALTFLDTQCTNVCPLQARMLGAAQSDLGATAPFSVVVVSVRPTADTPAAIATFAQANGLKGSLYWLTGTPAQLSAVWDSYGVGVQAANGDLEHTSVIYLIDRAGFERVGFIDVPEPSAFENDVRTLDAT
ncbi:MAG TPA: SCO family protein [Candidatus Udaeobacter sp.]|nr:SCO family protein [Candidatus Udaeobacter sp.]